VPASAETAAVASARDAADDPAIWRDPSDPERSLIVATDKKEGLNVYDLRGRLRSNLAAGRVNNVDLRGDVDIAGHPAVLVAASDRNRIAPEAGRLALFRLDPATATLSPLASLAAEVDEAYGVCLYRSAKGPIYGFVVGKDGTITQIRLDLPAAAPSGTVVRRMKLATQSEGCVADDRTGALYVAEEDVGLWRFSAEPDGPTVGRLFASADGRRLAADAEGLAIAAEGARGGYLVASSQGDSTYALWRLPDLRFAGRFRIAGGTIDGTSDTDGIEISTLSFGPNYPGGLMVAQDGDNAPEAQNFKLVSWAAVKRALRLR
jgi:3-phytase